MNRSVARVKQRKDGAWHLIDLPSGAVLELDTNQPFETQFLVRSADGVCDMLPREWLTLTKPTNEQK